MRTAMRAANTTAMRAAKSRCMPARSCIGKARAASRPKRQPKRRDKKTRASDRVALDVVSSDPRLATKVALTAVTAKTTRARLAAAYLARAPAEVAAAVAAGELALELSVDGEPCDEEGALRPVILQRRNHSPPTVVEARLSAARPDPE